MVESELHNVRSYRLEQISNIFFLLASVSYLVSAVKDNNHRGDDDDTDVENATTAATKEQNEVWIFLCLGALGWVFVGLIDWYNKRHWFHIFLVLAGIFGLVSALLRLENEKGSEILNSLSVHCFLLEGISLLRQDRKLPKSDYTCTLKFANLCFFVGALIDVVLSYVYLNEEEYLSPIKRIISLQRGEIASSTFWLVAACGHLLITVLAGKGGMKSSPAAMMYTTDQSGNTNLSKLHIMA